VGHFVLVTVTVAYNSRPLPYRVSPAISRSFVATLTQINNQSSSQTFRTTKIEIAIQLLQLKIYVSGT
jgi:hypothetical protein